MSPKQNGSPVINPRSPHTFHIPVMGTGFTIDTPLKVARYGISSVVSVVDDMLIEKMRKFHSERIGEPFVAIEEKEEDHRARRITAYLNLLGKLVKEQVAKLRQSPFEPGSEITRYYDLLPECPQKDTFRTMERTPDPAEKARLQDALRSAATPGSIDVNIMTKVDRDNYQRGKKLPPEFSDALSALRGFAKSDLNSSVVFSAGLNQRLYAYAAEFPDFLPDEDGTLRKGIILKVSDYRSAEIQGKFFARKGLWVSEYRIESGLNCGGHAFATKGHLLGPILHEFKEKRRELMSGHFAIFAEALKAKGIAFGDTPPPTRVTVQGGIGDADEDQFLIETYEVDSTGWATPFLLVPEVVNVDDDHLKRLMAATDDDVYLSDSSPLGIPFWNLRTSASEDKRVRLVEEGVSGSECPNEFLVSNTEFSRFPICLASRAYQKRKLKQLEEEDGEPELQHHREEYVLIKSCLCRDLSGGVLLKHGIDTTSTPAICCGPNIANFSKLATLEEMVGHIYGRLSLLTNPNRPHMFIRELGLYIEYLHREIEKCSQKLSHNTPKYLAEFKEGLLSGIEYYYRLSERIAQEKRSRFIEQLEDFKLQLETLQFEPALAAPVGEI